jgi:pyruvate,orthophosphate dikinase
MEPSAVIYPFDHPHECPHASAVQLLGGKGASLWAMTHKLGLPVPPGFTLPTSWCQHSLDGGLTDADRRTIRAGVERVGQGLGRRFGEGPLPLLLSVRSGAASSMPGMMDTVLNVGLTASSCQALANATGDRGFAEDSWLRFLRAYAHIVLEIHDLVEPSAGAAQLPWWQEQLEARIGAQALNDPWHLLFSTIEAVFRSWNSPRAKHYRDREQLHHLTGTAVNVQAMVFGNLDDFSGTGVLFTRDPMTGEARARADYLAHAQGDDVVSGNHVTQDLAALSNLLPAVHAELSKAADAIECYYRDMGDIEFTIESGRLWILQARVGKRSPSAAARIAVEMQADPRYALSRAEALKRVPPEVLDGRHVVARACAENKVLARGLGASPGVASGRIVFDPDHAVEWTDRGEYVILVRRETSPEDVHGMGVSKGILTTLGGLMCHAAVVARSWGIPAVVGAESITLDGGEMHMAGRIYREGDSISIDGETGCVYAGAVHSDARQVDSFVTELRRWREELAASC